MLLSGSVITNNGRIISSENTGMGAGRIRVDSNLTLAGTGELWLRASLYTIGGFTLTNGPNHTIRYGDDPSGSGMLDVPLIDQGIVRSDYGGKSIVLCTNPKSNHQFIDATNGGTLDLRCSISQDGNARIRALGGNVYLNNATITGGHLDATPGFEFQTGGNSVNSLVGVHNHAVVRAINNNSILALAGEAITNDGTLIATENTGMGAGQLRVDANVSLTGTGELWARTRVFSDNASVLRNAPEHTIRYGDVASGDGLLDVALLNEGTVRADYPGKSIIIRDQAKTNHGLMEATNGAYLELRGVVITQPAGVIPANGGNVRLRGVYLDRGTIASTGGSIIESMGGSFSTFDNVTNEGAVKMWNNDSILAVRGTLTNHGAIELYQNTGMGSGRMQIDSNNVEFHGGGKVLVYSEIVSPAGFPLVNGPGHTIGGTGWVRPAVVNQGILAPGASVGTLNSNGPVCFTPTAALHVELASASSYDRLAVGSNAELDGSLLIELVGGFLPARGNTFTVLTSAARSGSFVNASPFTLIPTIDGLAGFIPDYTGSSVVLKNFTRLGDVNLDNAVNNQDIPGFVALLTGGRPLGDWSGDPDFAPLMNLVPEPTSLSLLGFASMIALRRRRR